MSRKATLLVAVSLLFAFPISLAEEGADDGPDENATWGLCTAQDANEGGDEASNGTVSSTPAYNDTDEEDCEEAEHPANDTGGPEDRPGADDNPGDDRGEQPDERSDEADDRRESQGGEDGDDGSDRGR
jgi:hypothetical protein